ncbi:hypothetical protein [Desulforamulus ruminis]|uniref:hypothetical protein n=1 Tax=Desulforamulus ruminis TaxID=1564 RepID=UPI002357FAA7|nr:hypothetical protein [Desulforamulus ruminis]
MIKLKFKNNFKDQLSLESFFGDQKLDIKCPGCEHVFKLSFSDALQEGRFVPCPSCNSDIELIHDDVTKKTIADAEKAIKEFEKALKQFGK